MPIADICACACDMCMCMCMLCARAGVLARERAWVATPKMRRMRVTKVAPFLRRRASTAALSLRHEVVHRK